MVWRNTKSNMLNGIKWRGGASEHWAIQLGPIPGQATEATRVINLFTFPVQGSSCFLRGSNAKE